jgi:Ser/Thr protein kinase RdoA (MazF antagonist)
LLNAYESVRPLTVPSVAALPLLAAVRAMRFLLTRLVDWLNVPGRLREAEGSARI